MSTHRFYSPNLSASSIQLDAEQSAHARKSLRLAIGDTVELFDGSGHIASGTITTLAPTLHIQISNRREVPPTSVHLHIAAAIPKGPRADFMVDSLAQLGVNTLTPLITDRSVVAPGSGKQDRFNRIALEAAKQSARAHLMQIDPPTKLPDLLAHVQLPAANYDLKLIADPSATPISPLPQANRVIALIGPEGGWTPGEIHAAISGGFRGWQFGPHIMRIETAAIAAASIIRASSPS